MNNKKNKFITILIAGLYFVIYLVYSTPKIGAQSPSPEITSTSENTDAQKEIRKMVQEKVQKMLETTKLGQKRAYVGEITEIINSILTLNTALGEKQIKVATDAAIISKGNKKVELKDLEIGSFAIAMGYLTEENVLETRRLVVINKPTSPAREVAFGKVTDISAEEKILTVKQEKKGITYTIVVNDKTMITKKLDTKVEKASFSDIKQGDVIVAIGTPAENERKVITAKIIHVIPGSPGVKSTATPTAKATPTKKAEPTLTPTPEE